MPVLALCIYVKIMLSSVKVAEWSPFGKVLNVFLFVIFVFSQFGFEDIVLIVAVPGHCLLYAGYNYQINKFTCLTIFIFVFLYYF